MSKPKTKIVRKRMWGVFSGDDGLLHKVYNPGWWTRPEVRALYPGETVRPVIVEYREKSK